MKKKILEVKNLSMQFGPDRQVLDDVSFVIREGDIVSLIGLNGTGKTTLLKAVVGVLKPTAGRIKKFGSRVFYVPQKSDLNTTFPLTVREFCELFGGDGYQKYLESMGVFKFLERKVSDLSGGEYQRVVISIAMSSRPDLLLLDEVTSGVDLSGEEQFYELILKLREEFGVAVVVVSHNIHLVMRKADQVLCLAGKICCSGKPQDVKNAEVFKSVFGKYLQPYVHHHEHIH